MKSKKTKVGQNYIKLTSIALIIGGFVGLLASFMLAVETVEYIRDPEKALSCSINPIINCSSVIDTPQGEVFGFMNPLIGVAAFSALIVFGIAVYYRAKFPAVIWKLAQIISVLAIVFVHWLIYSSLYVIGSLCPYCMVVWVATIAIGFYVTLYNLYSGTFSKKSLKLASFMHKYQFVILAVWYSLILSLIIMQFGLDSLLA